MTSTDVINKYTDFFNTNNGKPVETEDSSNLWQCMDLAFAWCDKLGIDRATIRHLFAYQVWTQPLDITVQYFNYFPNTPNGVPKTGDLIIFNQGVGVAGHISIGSGAGNTMNFTSFDQNWGGLRYARLVSHPYDNVYGWLRPITSVDTTGLQNQINSLQTKINNAKTALA